MSLSAALQGRSAPSPSDWSWWRAHFERNRARPLPFEGPAALPVAQARALAWSLARFQIGETGEGRIVGAVARSRMPGIDDDYRRALQLFIGEEGRHARILAVIVRALGGSLLAGTWSAGAFVVVRRLLGIRCKLLAMFAAEVVGIAFYGALAASLPRCAIRQALDRLPATSARTWRFTSASSPSRPARLAPGAVPAGLVSAGVGGGAGRAGGTPPDPPDPWHSGARPGGPPVRAIAEGAR